MKRTSRPRLQTRAKERGYSLRVLAQRLGTNHESVRNWCAGRGTPNAAQTQLLAKLLGYTDSEMLAELNAAQREYAKR